MSTARRLTPLPPLPLNAGFRVRWPRDEEYGPFTDQELRLYLDLADATTTADRVILTEADATLSDSDYVIDFLTGSAWTAANLSAGDWEGHLYANEVFVGGFRFTAYTPGGGEQNPQSD
jgi:hypothetical protein